jgi:hypothetical protein
MSAKLEKVTIDVIRRTAAPFASRSPIYANAVHSSPPLGAKIEKVTIDVIRRTAAPFASRPPQTEFSNQPSIP